MTTDLQLQHEVEQFYYDEAAMLDERRFSEWPDLFTDDVHYWMPIRRTLTSDQIDREFTNHPSRVQLAKQLRRTLPSN